MQERKKVSFTLNYFQTFSGFINENDFGKFGMNQRLKAMKTECRARLKGINLRIILIAVSSSGDELVSSNVK